MTAVSNEGTYHVDDNAIYNMKHYHTHTHRIYDTTFRKQYNNDKGYKMHETC